MRKDVVVRITWTAAGRHYHLSYTINLECIHLYTRYIYGTIGGMILRVRLLVIERVKS